MAFSISSVTDAGRTAMQIALDNDYPLIFTALRSGNGSYTEGEDVTSRTALKSLKNSFAIGSREDLEHSVKLGAVLTNYDGTSTIVSESYNVNEIGLFCTVNNIEYLYALAAAPNDSGRELPAYDGTNLTQIVQTWTVALTNDAEIQVEMSGAYALAADLTTEIANRKVADSKDNTVTYTSADDVSIFNSGDLGGDSDYAWAPVAKIDSAEKHSVLFNKVSTMFKNIRTIAKLIGTTDISAVGDGTVSGAIGTLSSDLSELENYTVTSINTQNEIINRTTAGTSTYTLTHDCVLLINIFTNTSTDSGGSVYVNDVEIARATSRAGLINTVSSFRCKAGDVVRGKVSTPGGQVYVYECY